MSLLVTPPCTRLLCSSMYIIVLCGGHSSRQNTHTDRTAASYFYALQNHLAGRIKSVRGPHALHKEKFSRGPHSIPSRSVMGHGSAGRTFDIPAFDGKIDSPSDWTGTLHIKSNQVIQILKFCQNRNWSVFCVCVYFSNKMTLASLYLFVTYGKIGRWKNQKEMRIKYARCARIHDRSCVLILQDILCPLTTYRSHIFIIFSSFYFQVCKKHNFPTNFFQGIDITYDEATQHIWNSFEFQKAKWILFFMESSVLNSHGSRQVGGLQKVEAGSYTYWGTKIGAHVTWDAFVPSKVIQEFLCTVCMCNINTILKNFGQNHEKWSGFYIFNTHPFFYVN